MRGEAADGFSEEPIDVGAGARGVLLPCGEIQLEKNAPQRELGVFAGRVTPAAANGAVDGFDHRSSTFSVEAHCPLEDIANAAISLSRGSLMEGRERVRDLHGRRISRIQPLCEIGVTAR
jgi:hypothetical protein